MRQLRLGFLAFGYGSLFQAVIDACREERLDAHPVVLISNRSSSGVFAGAERVSVPVYHLSLKTHPDEALLDSAICSVLKGHSPDLIILAGYLKKLGPCTLAAFAGKVINVHPALLPKFGGKGMYGNAVHEAVLRAGERETGVTIHLVTEEYDQGPILAQRVVPVLAADTSASLAERVLAMEHALLVDTIASIARSFLICRNRSRR